MARFSIVLMFATLSLIAGEEVRVEMTFHEDHLLFQPLAPYAGFTLEIQGEGHNLRQEYRGEEWPLIQSTDATGETLPDGLYLWRLTARPVLDDATRASMKNLAESGVDRAHLTDQLPRVTPLSGSFRIVDGTILKPYQTETSVAKDENGIGGDQGTQTGSLATDQDDGRALVYGENLIVQGSSCIGLDCLSNESFGYDTLRMKENNLRLHFDDTSTNSAFPKNDWRFIFNDSTNGGASYFAIEDTTAGKRPFRIDAGAPADSFHVDAQGDVGLGTSTPLMDLQLAQGDTPTIRLEQTTNFGWPAYSWDIGGNEMNFFIRDAGNNNLPFRVMPAAANNTLCLNEGGVGIGTWLPTSQLHVKGDSLFEGNLTVRVGNATIDQGNLTVDNGDIALTGGSFFMTSATSHQALIQNTNGTAQTRVLMELKNKGVTQMVFRNTAGARWGIGASATGVFFSDNTSGSASFNMEDSGEVTITDDNGTNILRLTDSGDLYLAGELQSGSPKTAELSQVTELKQQLASQAERLAAGDKELAAQETLLGNQARELEQLSQRVEQLMTRLDNR